MFSSQHVCFVYIYIIISSIVQIAGFGHWFSRVWIQLSSVISLEELDLNSPRFVVMQKIYISRGLAVGLVQVAKLKNQVIDFSLWLMKTSEPSEGSST